MRNKKTKCSLLNSVQSHAKQENHACVPCIVHTILFLFYSLEHSHSIAASRQQHQPGAILSILYLLLLKKILLYSCNAIKHTKLIIDVIIHYIIRTVLNRATYQTENYTEPLATQCELLLDISLHVSFSGHGSLDHSYEDIWQLT